MSALMRKKYLLTVSSDWYIEAEDEGEARRQVANLITENRREVIGIEEVSDERWKELTK